MHMHQPLMHMHQRVRDGVVRDGNIDISDVDEDHLDGGRGHHRHSGALCRRNGNATSSRGARDDADRVAADQSS